MADVNAHINDEQWDDMLELLEEDFVGLVKEYLLDSQKRLDIIQQAHKNADNDGGLEAAHAFKGASANIGAEQLSKHCFTMQEICHAKMIDAAHNVVIDIADEFAKVRAEIEQRLSNLEANK